MLPLPKFSKRIDDSDNGQGQRRLTFQPEPSVPRRAGTGSGAHPGNAAEGSGGIARESTNAVENIEDDDDAKVFKRLEAIAKAAGVGVKESGDGRGKSVIDFSGSGDEELQIVTEPARKRCKVADLKVAPPTPPGPGCMLARGAEPELQPCGVAWQS